MVVNKVKKKAIIIDLAILGSTRVCDKEHKKVKKCSLLKDENARLWQNEKVPVIPIVVATLETIITKFEEYTESLEIDIRIEHVQKSALLRTARIMGKLLSC